VAGGWRQHLHAQVWGLDTSLGAEERVRARCPWAARPSRGGHVGGEKRWHSWRAAGCSGRSVSGACPPCAVLMVPAALWAECGGSRVLRRPSRRRCDLWTQARRRCRRAVWSRGAGGSGCFSFAARKQQPARIACFLGTLRYPARGAERCLLRAPSPNSRNEACSGAYWAAADAHRC
jgi:hypothetical protein